MYETRSPEGARDDAAPGTASCHRLFRTVVIDDDRCASRGMAALLDSMPEFRCLDVRADVPGRDQAPDEVDGVALAVPKLRELPARIAAARRAFPAARVLVVGELCSVLSTEAALRCGAAGYVAKEDPVAIWRAALASLRGSAHWICPEVAQLVYARRARPETSYRLAPREREVLALVGRGRSTRTIASELSIATKTVESLRARICAKLGARSPAELVAAAELHAALAPEPALGLALATAPAAAPA